MTRQVILDTETTGLSWEKGNRVIEIGCVELVQRRPTGRKFQRYLNPDRAMEPGAQEVTGLSAEFLADKPRFAEVVEEFLEFIDGAEVIAHNASFDVGFLENELRLLGGQHGTLIARCSVIDSLHMARERYPGQRNSLDALCRRLGVDNTGRALHGALLDAQLLADVYLALTAGQGDLVLETVVEARTTSVVLTATASTRPVLHASSAELALHRQRLQRIDEASAGRLVWQGELESELA